jgi:AraC family transcriptional regulator
MSNSPYSSAPMTMWVSRLPKINGASAQHPIISKALRIINERSAEGGLRQPDVAAAVAVSPTHFSYLFRQISGLTFQDYLAVWRVRRVLLLLAQNPFQSVTRAALEAGFPSLRTCELRFKQFLGISPTDFRDEMRAWVRQTDLELE